MPKDLNRLNLIYSKTDGCCHICHSKLIFSNHGLHNAKGAWHIDHSIPRAKGGKDHLNNLYPACIYCNIVKSTSPTRQIRAKNGVARAPYSKAKKDSIKDDNASLGMIIGGVIGAIGGPIGITIGAAIGGFIGNQNSPDR